MGAFAFIDALSVGTSIELTTQRGEKAIATGQNPVPAGGPAGLVLTSTGPSSPAAFSGPYLTLMDLDFTAQPSQAFNADGAFTIAGLVWQKVNSADENPPHAEIVNGTGLVFTTPTGAYNAASMALPYLWLPLSAILGTVPADWSNGIRVYTSVGAETFAPGHTPNGLIIGICNNSLGLTQDNGLFFFRGQPTGGVNSHSVEWARVGGNAPQSINTDDSITPAAGNSTLCFDMPKIGSEAVAPQNYHAAQLAVGASFPALSTFQPDVGAGNSLQTAKMGGTVSTFAQMGLLIGASSQGAGGYSTVVQRVRVDIRL